MTKVLVIENWLDRAAGIANLLVDAGLSQSIVRPYAGEPLPAVDGFDLVILSGGPMSVADADSEEYEFLHDVMDFTRQLVHRSMPCLGICLGHQLLATVLGGSVEPMGYLDAGIRSIRAVENVANVGRSFSSFVFHRDHVVDVPPHCVRTFTSDACVIEGFRHEARPIQAVQFHPEVPRDRAIALLDRWRSAADGRVVAGDPASFDDRKAQGEFRSLVSNLLRDAGK
jgi:GMP synthase-like glutamine amidotransferase